MSGHGRAGKCGVTSAARDQVTWTLPRPRSRFDGCRKLALALLRRMAIARWGEVLGRVVPPDGRVVRAVRRLWYGRTLERPTYHVAAALFLRMLGFVYLIAFVSLWTQVDGLVGDHGILPVSKFLDAARRYFAAEEPQGSPVWNVPTLMWLSPHDGLLHLLCAAGTLISLTLIAGWMPMPSLVLLWVLYLSLFHAGQVFLSFQWDILLLETGFIAIFVAPFAWRSRFLGDGHPPRLALWLVWWLLFRLMFESGAVKLTWNDAQSGPDGLPIANAWESLTALYYHYWTQPLPDRISWYAAQLPHWFHKWSVVGVLSIELVLPWFIFGPRALRFAAFCGIALLMLLIGATGNYNFFNLLTFVLALTLLDDGVWPEFLRRRIRLPDASTRAGPKRGRRVFLVAFAGLAIVLGTCQLVEAIAPVTQAGASLEANLHIAQFAWVNGYGLFRRMTETRPEIVIEGRVEGSDDWQAYEFRWKPGDPSRPPGFNTPHQPRLDWQMWFEALQLEHVYELAGTIDRRTMSPWFQSLIVRLLQRDPQVLRLLAHEPFSTRASRSIRVVLYEYRFTDFSERRASGDWWRRQRVWTGPAWSLPR